MFIHGIEFFAWEMSLCTLFLCSILGCGLCCHVVWMPRGIDDQYDV